MVPVCGLTQHPVKPFCALAYVLPHRRVPLRLPYLRDPRAPLLRFPVPDLPRLSFHKPAYEVRAFQLQKPLVHPRHLLIKYLQPFPRLAQPLALLACAPLLEHQLPDYLLVLAYRVQLPVQLLQILPVPLKPRHLVCAGGRILYHIRQHLAYAYLLVTGLIANIGIFAVESAYIVRSVFYLCRFEHDRFGRKYYSIIISSVCRIEQFHCFDKVAYRSGAYVLQCFEHIFMIR